MKRYILEYSTAFIFNDFLEGSNHNMQILVDIGNKLYLKSQSRKNSHILSPFLLTQNDIFLLVKISEIGGCRIRKSFQGVLRLNSIFRFALPRVFTGGGRAESFKLSYGLRSVESDGGGVISCCKEVSVRV